MPEIFALFCEILGGIVRFTICRVNFLFLVKAEKVGLSHSEFINASSDRPDNVGESHDGRADNNSAESQDEGSTVSTLSRGCFARFDLFGIDWTVLRKCSIVVC